MKLIPHNPVTFAKAGMGYLKDGNEVRLTVRDRPGDVRVKITDDGLAFYPERSSGHRAVLTALGELD
jgi:hypothetical protein